MRSTARLNEIDTYLAEHYTKDGGRACATALRETLPYISSRVQHIDLCKPKLGTSRKKINPNSQKIVVLLAKIDAKNKEIKEYQEALFKMEKLYKNLRVENMILVDEKVKLKLGKINE